MRDITYLVEVSEKGPGNEPNEPTVYEVDAPNPEQACYTAKDWYVDEFHAHDLDPDKDLVCVARPQTSLS